MNDPGNIDEVTWKKRLDDGAREMGVELDESQVEVLWRYAHAARHNKREPLTSIVSPEGILTLHMLDSLSLAPHLGDGRRIIDVGTGGFPALPLAVAFPQREFTLIDGTQKIRFVPTVPLRPSTSAMCSRWRRAPRVSRVRRTSTWSSRAR
jgi:16S rRNA (guanine527-N7)-methyltransferase